MSADGLETIDLSRETQTIVQSAAEVDAPDAIFKKTKSNNFFAVDERLDQIELFDADTTLHVPVGHKAERLKEKSTTLACENLTNWVKCRQEDGVGEKVTASSGDGLVMK